jgi:hypothetical protein
MTLQTGPFLESGFHFLEVTINSIPPCTIELNNKENVYAHDGLSFD